MTVLRAFAIVVIAGALGAGLGALIGYALATLAPGYYATVFPHAAAQPSFNPVHVGVGLGLTQGLIAGLLIGCVVVLAVAIASRFRLPAVTDAAAASAWGRAPAGRPDPSGGGAITRVD
jgi:hypothetical protein